MSKISEVKEAWAKSIIAQALEQIKKPGDVPKVCAEVEGTALAVRKDYMKTFRALVGLKVQFLKSRAGAPAWRGR